MRKTLGHRKDTETDLDCHNGDTNAHENQQNRIACNQIQDLADCRKDEIDNRASIGDHSGQKGCFINHDSPPLMRKTLGHRQDTETDLDCRNGDTDTHENFKDRVRHDELKDLRYNGHEHCNNALNVRNKGCKGYIDHVLTPVISRSSGSHPGNKMQEGYEITYYYHQYYPAESI